LLGENDGDHLEEDWAWADDDAIPHPEVVSDQSVISQDPTIGELKKTWCHTVNKAAGGS